MSSHDLNQRPWAVQLVPAVDPPGLPWQLSADLEHGFVIGGKAFIADPLAMLRSFVALLEQWWAQPAERRALAWGTSGRGAISWPT